MSLGRSFATVGGLTMVSRLLGFGRDVLIARYLGAGAEADAFFVAFRFPNLFRRLFAEGAFNMAFVPLFAKRLEVEGEDAARGFAEDALAGLMSVLFVFTLVAQLAMPWLIYLIAAGFADDQGKLDMAVLFTRIEFPYLLFMSLTALYSAVLNSLRKFAVAAAAPIVLNLVLISAMALAAWRGWPVGQTLAWGVLLAGGGQFALVWRAAGKAGMHLRLRRPRMTPGMRRLIELGVPGAISGGAMQINLLIGTTIASFFAGAVAHLQYADRIYQLPLGVVGVAIGVVLLPELSRRMRAEDWMGARNAMSRAFEFAMVLTLPAAAALMIIPEQIVSVLYARGAFTSLDAAETGAALQIFAAGLPAFVLQKVVAPAYFAREDMRSPLRFALWSMAVNTVVSVTLAPVMGFLAIPLGTTIAGWLNFALLWRGAKVHGDDHRMDARLARRLPRIVMASAVMASGVSLCADIFAEELATVHLRFAAMAALIAFGMALYAIAGRVTGGIYIADLLGALRRRPRAGAEGSTAPSDRARDRSV